MNRNYYTIERNGKTRQATAEQLRTYHEESDIHVDRDNTPNEVEQGSEVESGSEAVQETEIDSMCLNSRTGVGQEGYMHARNFSTDSEGTRLAGPAQRTEIQKAFPTLP